MTGLRVVLAEDDVLFREGLASLLERSGYEVVGQAGDGRQLLALARETEPDLVVADIRMPLTHTTEGLEAARVIRQELLDTAILVLSAYAQVEHAGAAVWRRRHRLTGQESRRRCRRVPGCAVADRRGRLSRGPCAGLGGW